MRNPFEHKATPSGDAQPTQQQMEERRAKLVEALDQVRLKLRGWMSRSGRTRDEMIKALEQSIEAIDQMLIHTRSQPPATTENIAPTKEKQRQALNTAITDALNSSPAGERTARAGDYITLGGIKVPVCDNQSTASHWDTVPGGMYVSGGSKFANVRYVKDMRGGLTYTAMPGELLTFSERHRNTRLESIDTILQGKNELKAFKLILKALGELSRAYDELSPDEPSYSAEAKRIADQILSFTTPEGLGTVVDLSKIDLDDLDDFKERAADIIRVRQFLRSIDDDVSEFIPALDPHFKVSPFFERQIGWFASLVNRQLGLGNNAYIEELVKNEQAPDWEKLSAKGMTMVVGPRGTGKNKLVDYYCAMTQRPLFRYACSPDKEERDLTYDVELQDGNVVKIPTRILTAITTPNAVLELDEVNLLRPNVSKFLNSLLDGDRAVFLNDQVVKAAPGVVIVGLMNPADYDGVEDLPETIDDRSNIMTHGYPPLREIDSSSNREHFTHDEALILKEYIQPLKALSDEQFKKAWDYVVNSIGAQVSLDTTAIIVMKDLKNIVSIANRTRQVVEAYKTRTGETRMDRDISLRGTIEAARFYSENHLWESDLSKLPDWKSGWNAAQYAIAMTYLPHTETYRRGKTDKETIMLILAEAIR